MIKYLCKLQLNDNYKDMALDYESRKLLGDIYECKPDQQVTIQKRLYSKGFVEMLESFQKKKMIKDLSIHKDELENPLFGYDSEKGTVYNINFAVRSWQKLDDFGGDEYNKIVTEPYGKEKQLKITKEAIIDKAIGLENIQFRIDNGDLGYPDKEHVVIFEVLDELQKENFLELLDSSFYIDTGDFECDIKLLKNLKELKAKRAKKDESEKQKTAPKNEPTPSPKFRFNQGVLFRDFCNEILIVKGENTKEYRLLDTVIALPVRERIDALTENIEMEWRQLYDTARRLNGKIKDIFKIDNFFQIDFQNKKLHRTVE